VAVAGGAGFWCNPSWFEEAAKMSIKLLEDDGAVADTFAGLLGELAAASHSQAAKDAVCFLFRAFAFKKGGGLYDPVNLKLVENFKNLKSDFKNENVK
jgi:hypothetical protein